MMRRLGLLLLLVILVPTAWAGAWDQKICGTPYSFPPNLGCFTFGKCEVGVRGDWLDWVDTAIVLSPPPRANVKVGKKGTDNNHPCVPSFGLRVGYVVLSLEDITDSARRSGEMRIRLNHPLAVGGPRFTDIAVDVQNGTHVMRKTFYAEENKPEIYELRGANLTSLKVLPYGREDDRILSADNDSARVRLTFGGSGTTDLGTKLGFDDPHAFLNKEHGWPIVNVKAAPPPTVNTVTVTISSAGSTAASGKVTSVPPGIDCPGTCTFDFTQVGVGDILLTATPSRGSRFEGYSGACGAVWRRDGAPASPECILSGKVRTARVDARFDQYTQLTVRNEDPTGGTITSSGDAPSAAPIQCGRICTTRYPNIDARVTLTAVPAALRRFKSWGVPGCPDAVPTCTFTIGKTDRVVEPKFIEARAE